MKRMLANILHLNVQPPREVSAVSLLDKRVKWRHNNVQLVFPAPELWRVMLDGNTPFKTTQRIRKRFIPPDMHAYTAHYTGGCNPKTCRWCKDDAEKARHHAGECSTRCIWCNYPEKVSQ